MYPQADVDLAGVGAPVEADEGEQKPGHWDGAEGRGHQDRHHDDVGDRVDPVLDHPLARERRPEPETIEDDVDREEHEQGGTENLVENVAR